MNAREKAFVAVLKAIVDADSKLASEVRNKLQVKVDSLNAHDREVNAEKFEIIKIARELGFSLNA